ncbi:MAG: hypothetical protein MZU79_04505 [Anaerotruncus sp.]|nr:hypothetical protein [Anaerotruncus sp.]
MRPRPPGTGGRAGLLLLAGAGGDDERCGGEDDDELPGSSWRSRARLLSEGIETQGRLQVEEGDAQAVAFLDEGDLGLEEADDGVGDLEGGGQALTVEFGGFGRVLLGDLVGDGGLPERGPLTGQGDQGFPDLDVDLARRRLEVEIGHPGQGPLFLALAEPGAAVEERPGQGRADAPVPVPVVEARLVGQAVAAAGAERGQPAEHGQLGQGALGRGQRAQGADVQAPRQGLRDEPLGVRGLGGGGFDQELGHDERPADGVRRRRAGGRAGECSSRPDP